MTLRWQVTLPDTSTSHEVHVAAPPSSTVAELRTALAAQLPVAQLSLLVDGQAVDDHATLGMPPLLDGAVLTFTSLLGDHAGALAGRALLQLHARSGPDTGYVFDLPPGEHLVGRWAQASVRLDDADVSRAHAMLRVGTRDVTAHDAGSTNGTFLDGAPVGAQPVPLQAGQQLRVGRTTLELCLPQDLPAAVRPDGSGHLLVNRSPSLTSGPVDEVVRLPSEPIASVPTRLSWFAMLLPLALSAVMAAVLRSPTMLLFGLMSPALLLGQWLGDRRGARRTRKQAHARYAEELATAQQRLASALAAESAARRVSDPDPAAILAIARRPLARLWERDARADAIRGRVGVGELPARTSCTGGDELTVGPVPVCVQVSAAGGVGIAGPRAKMLASARALLGGILTLYSPRDLRIVVASSGDHQADWQWLSRMPHADDTGASGEQLLEALAATVAADAPRPGQPAWAGPRTLLVVDGAARLRSHPGLTTVLADGHRAGVHTLALDAQVSRLPAEAASVLDLGADPPTLLAHGECITLAGVDAVALGWAERLAEALVPLRDSAPAPASAAVPRTVSLLRLLQLPDAGAAALVDRWSRTPRSTRFPLGAGRAGPLLLDLERDGPHALVGGTTGSGKSELLLCLVASLAAVNRPDELAMLLVDYKGGAAFAGCAGLPHVVGVVTDLDAELTERAITSLDAELKRRERLLTEHGCRDLASYVTRRQPRDPPLPRLVIVVDEFRALAEDLPDFVAGLVRVASLGRSLGIHLVVATQRPAGVVTADMRANLGLRIALRVRDVVDSLDVLDAPEAARIRDGTPGRAFLRSAASPLAEFQCALVTGRTEREDGVRLLALDGIPVASASAHPEPDLQRLVRACQQAAQQCGAAPPAPPWLPPLPRRLSGRTLAAAPGQVAVGLLDDPAAQAQRPYLWALSAGHLGLIGSPRSGRTTALRTVAVQLAEGASPVDVHLYAVHTGALAPLAGLPHLGAEVDLSDLSRLDRLCRLLAEPAASGTARRVLLVDDWDVLAETLLGAGQNALLDALVRLLRRGQEQQLRAAVAGGRTLARGALADLFTQRLLLLPADPVELATAGLTGRKAWAATSAGAPLGRAVDASTGHLVQLALPGSDAPAADPSRELAELGRLLTHRHPQCAPELLAAPVPPLPERVELDGIEPVAGLLAVGVGGDGPAGFRPEARQRRVVVLGRAGSGRSRALAVLGLGLRRLGYPVATVTPGGHLPSDGWPLGPGDVDELVALRRRHPRLAVLVDDADRLAGTAMEPVLTELARLVEQDRGFLGVATTVDEVLQRPLGLAATAATARCGLLLGGRHPGDEQALRCRGLLPFPNRPGRVHLVTDGVAQVVQLARVAAETLSSPA